LKYNALVLNPDLKPHNPFINAGAIMICSLLGKGLAQSQRFSETVQNWQKLAAGRPITFDNTVFLSEKNTNDINIALAYLMKAKKAFPEGTDIEDIVEYYTHCCSMESDSDTLSIIAATLANGGICPLNGERVLSSKTV
jgi:glutaminase